MIAALFVMQLAAAVPAGGARGGAPLRTPGGATDAPTLATDTLPRVTLADALRLAVRLDPDYVRAEGQVDNAAWSRRAAVASFFVPAVNVALDGTKSSSPTFNVGTGQPQSTSVAARFTASYELFSVRKFSELGRTRAEIASAEADVVDERMRTALEVESDYYDVLTNAELGRVADERVRRAEEALAVARARVTSGAAVQSDSLQLVLELQRARVDALRQGTALRVARFQLGRRVGASGAVDAAPLDSAPPPPPPITGEQAVELVLRAGPQLEAARAAERAADALVRSRRGEYLPSLTLSAAHNRFDTSFFPNLRNVSQVTFGLSFPLWNNAQREIAVSQARVAADVAEAQRADLERAVRRDVAAAYEGYTTARAAIGLTEVGVVAARENYRVQELRYRAGATTILDFLDAQVRLAQAEAELVETRYAARRALTALEVLLGRRLFTNGTDGGTQ
jgi:outer membrane protein TolC